MLPRPSISSQSPDLSRHGRASSKRFGRNSEGPRRPPPEPRGFIRPGEKLCTVYGILSQESGNMLFWLKLVRDFWDGFGSVGIRGICTMDVVCPCLHETLLIGPRTQPVSPSVAGDAHPWRSCVSLLHSLSDLEGNGQGAFIRARWHYLMCCVWCVHLGELEPSFLRYWLALGLCDLVGEFWYSRGDNGCRGRSW